MYKWIQWRRLLFPLQSPPATPKEKRMVARERFQNKMKVLKEMGVLLEEDTQGLYSRLGNSTNELFQEDWICLRKELSRFK